MQFVNTNPRQLRMFAREVTRVALEVGTHGVLGGQAQVMGVEGTWKDLTYNVNVRSPWFHLGLRLIFLVG
jgi:osomolarity two-component system sensor histidine kinase NIK1